jgi:1,2-diacylglycerol 3-beta-galactosyltransferase
MSANKKKVLILTGDAGLGHRSAAEAVQKAIEINYGDQCDVWVKNPLNRPDIPDFIRESQSDYDEVVKQIPELYEFGYKISDAKLPVALMEGGFTLLFINTLKDMLDQFTPDVIITTYPMFMAPLQNIFRSEEELAIPLITVVTDLITVHQVWFNNGVAKCTVPTQAVKKLALQAGLKEEQVANTGIPVNPQISELKDVDPNKLREELGWQKDLTTLLVVGSPRIVSLMDILETLDRSDHEIQFALVAGGNDALLEKFKSQKWQHPAHFYDFIDFMPKLMQASDLILCKAGGLIVTESLAAGLPIMLVHLIPGQEEGNMTYVLEHEAGVYCEEPEVALDALGHWLENDRELLKITAKNAADLGRPRAAFEIADIAWDLMS